MNDMFNDPLPLFVPIESRIARAEEEEEEVLASGSPPGHSLGYKISKYSAFDEAADVVARPSVREQESRDHLMKFKSNQSLVEQCGHLTREDCAAANANAAASSSGEGKSCSKLHFERQVFEWTDVRLGNCPYLNTCKNMRRCRYVHYRLDPGSKGLESSSADKASLASPELTQWINCDIRTFDLNILGKFGVVMADPPWHIHQDLPYGTMSDDEMRGLNLSCLQDDGVIFLWVTGRAIELGMECLALWGYKRVQELVWIKTNQLNELIRGGRTGVWLNHTKEHCLIGVKGDPDLNMRLDCDVLVAPVRETSRKPDEMYSLLERLYPNERKIEIFARQNNLKASHGWVGLGNQLNGSRILDPTLRARYEEKYGSIEEPKPPMHSHETQSISSSIVK